MLGAQLLSFLAAGAASYLWLADASRDEGRENKMETTIVVNQMDEMKHDVETTE